MGVLRRKICNQNGQGSVEAAVVIPVLFLLLLMILQPSIVLYDRIVMGNAAAEGCRLLATATGATGSMQGACEAFVRHRLAAIPQHDCFHVHREECSWDIQFDGSEASETVSVRIAHEICPLPLFDAGSRLLGLANERGNLLIEETVTMQTQPGWVASSPAGSNPAQWVGEWVS